MTTWYGLRAGLAMQRRAGLTPTIVVRIVIIVSPERAVMDGRPVQPARLSGGVMAVRSYAMERVAHLIVRGMDLSEDPRTVAKWARATFMSETQLRSSCRLTDLKARDVLGLVRVLRACRIRFETDCRWQDAIDVLEERTLAKLLRRGGVEAGATPTPQQCLMRQSFVREGALLGRVQQLTCSEGANGQASVPVL